MSQKKSKRRKSIPHNKRKKTIGRDDDDDEEEDSKDDNDGTSAISMRTDATTAPSADPIATASSQLQQEQYQAPTVDDQPLQHINPVMATNAHNDNVDQLCRDYMCAKPISIHIVEDLHFGNVLFHDAVSGKFHLVHLDLLTELFAQNVLGISQNEYNKSHADEQNKNIKKKELQGGGNNIAKRPTIMSWLGLYLHNCAFFMDQN